ncbi:MAG: L-aspartate oxidase [Planctomycetia bacterium]|nr:MAG: L-aspartate oxidase [Planctomycetia bacterium]
MSSAIAARRYLTNFEPHRVSHLFCDVLVLGAGVAGMRAALQAAEAGDVLLVTKDSITGSATAWAQGGIAAATDEADSAERHAQDTLNVACGLGDERITRLVVSEAPARIAEMIGWGARFDVGSDQRLALGREGGHSAARIVHAAGDATGREVARVLYERVRVHPRIRVFERCFVIDLLSADGAVVGALTQHPKYGHQMFWAGATILATGGAGCVYRETTNPRACTGDGLAMALRAGATLRDMEMVQFHPTTLYVAGAARLLISEAVRGEGGRLVTAAGRRFMPEIDPRAELAPRDVVSRAITQVMRSEQAPCVYLDVRHLPAGRFAERFPGITATLAQFDLDPARDLIPVRPAAHYSVGGVACDADTRTAVEGLLAAGEVASSGLHGANRLASNSLLEGLVFGARAGRTALERCAGRARLDRPLPVSHLLPASPRTGLDLEDVTSSLRSVMSRNVGVERSGDRLRETIEIIEFWGRYVMDKVFDEPRAWETQNMLSVALCIATGAALRCESRGTHYRSDYPQTDEAWRRHIDLRRGAEGLDVSTAGI